MSDVLKALGRLSFGDESMQLSVITAFVCKVEEVGRQEMIAAPENGHRVSSDSAHERCKEQDPANTGEADTRPRGSGDLL
jgi:hypothetical protein